MKAIAITPGTADAQLIDIPEPTLVEPDDVKLQVISVGICGTDREEVSGGRADAPAGQSRLIIGHEMFGRVIQVGSQVKKVEPGDYAVFSVRRGCGKCPACLANRSDMCYSGDYRERGIRGADGYQTEYVVDKEQYLVKVPAKIAHIGVLTEPMSVIEKALDEAVLIQLARLPDMKRAADVLRNKVALVAGLGPIGLLATVALRLRGAKVIGLDIIDENSPRAQLLAKLGGVYVDGRKVQADALDDHLGQIDLILEATGVAALEFNLIDALGINGIYVITGIPGGDRPIDISGAALMRQLVLYNQVVVGSVNASPAHFQMAVDDLKCANEQWPQVMSELITRHVPYAQFKEALTQHSDADIKVVVDWSPNGTGKNGTGNLIGRKVPQSRGTPNKPTPAMVFAALHDSDLEVRQETIHALCNSFEPTDLQSLTLALSDDDPGVRWLAAEGLVEMGERGVETTLQILKAHSDSILMRESAHHVLSAFLKQPWGRSLTPAIQALESVEPALTVPWIAEHLLASLNAIA